VTDITDPNNPVYKGSLQAPFPNWHPNQYENLYPLPNTYWDHDDRARVRISRKTREFHAGKASTVAH
jgi:hypothetical protein